MSAFFQLQRFSVQGHADGFSRKEGLYGQDNVGGKVVVGVLYHNTELGLCGETEK